MHLVRLARMAEEILKDGVVLVKRPDAEELKGILRGEWKYEDIEQIGNNLDTKLNSLYKNSPLRDKPDHKKISELYTEICEQKYNIQIKGSN
jgi:hypothetical protein